MAGAICDPNKRNRTVCCPTDARTEVMRRRSKESWNNPAKFPLLSKSRQPRGGDELLRFRRLSVLREVHVELPLLYEILFHPKQAIS